MTQNEMIIKHLCDHKSITPWEAMREYGCMRLSERIREIERSGFSIRHETETNINKFGKPVRYARYVLGTVNI